MRARALSFSVIVVAASLSLPFSGCGKGTSQTVSDKPVLTVNNLQLNKEELRQEYQADSLMRHEPSTAQGEPEWVSRLVERELLVQEAQRLGLDRDPAFMHSIERFWKEVLIKLLLDRKGREISEQVQVYEPEVEAYYKKLAEEKSGTPIEPLSQLRQDLRRQVRQKKEMEALEQWVNGLREKSKIMIDQESLKELS